MKFSITIIDRVATPVNPPTIICGNSDYVIEFVFDDEWNNIVAKTARFTYVKDGKQKFDEIVFAGNLCPMPILSDITEVNVGVYAGDLKTTTPAKLICEKSILCGSNTHSKPSEDVYNQIMSMLANNYPLEAGISANEAALYATNTVNKAMDDLANSQFIEAIKEQNKGQKFKMWEGTLAEYEALPVKDAHTLYVITDEDYFEDVKQELRDIIKPVLLWENPAPTDSWNEQTLNIDLSKYNGVKIVFRNCNTEIISGISTAHYTYQVVECMEKGLTYYAIPDQLYNYHRYFKVNDNSIYFSYIKNQSQDDRSPQLNKSLVPYKIYGLQY